MNQAEFRQSIVNAFSRISDLELTDWGRFPNQRSLVPSYEFQSIALNSYSGYEEVYRKGLELLHYNFILTDYSYFQFYIEPASHNMRYAFYSNPYQIPQNFASFSDEMIAEGEVFMLGELYAQELDEAELQLDIPPVRFDYDPSSHNPTKHPAGHLHIGIYQGSRIAVRRVLTPLNFALFIIKTFYPSYWSGQDYEEPDGDGFTNLYDNYLAKSKNECVLVEQKFFTENEEKLPYLD